MNTIIQRLLRAARKYSVMDFVLFKTTLVFLGILLGAYFSNFFLNYSVFLWVIFIVAYIAIMFRTFKHMN